MQLELACDLTNNFVTRGAEWHWNETRILHRSIYMILTSINLSRHHNHKCRGDTIKSYLILPTKWAVRKISLVVSESGRQSFHTFAVDA